jgi:hypothetical protein
MLGKNQVEHQLCDIDGSVTIFFHSGSGSVGNQDHTDAEVQEVLAHAEQPLPSLTPFRKPVHRSASLRHSWSQQASVREQASWTTLHDFI